VADGVVARVMLAVSRYRCAGGGVIAADATRRTGG
jgi:hypothetical protein